MKLVANPVLKAISKMKGILGTDLKILSCKFTKQGLSIGASSSAVSISFFLPECQGKGEFSINEETLTKMLLNRDYVDCKLDDSNLHFQKDKYKGVLTTMPYIAVEVEASTDENLVHIPFNSDLAQHFNKARKHLALTNKSNSDSHNYMYVKAENGTISCMVFDDVHFGMYRSETAYKGDPMMFNLVTSTLTKILSVTDKGEFNMTIGSDLVYLETENLKASITMTQSDQRRFEILLGMNEKIVKAIKSKVSLRGEEVTNIVTNMLSIYEDGSAIKVAISDEGASFKYDTTYGKISEVLVSEKKKGKGALAVGPYVLEDLANVFPEGAMTMGITEMTNNNKKTSQLVFQFGKAITYIMTPV